MVLDGQLQASSRLCGLTSWERQIAVTFDPRGAIEKIFFKGKKISCSGGARELIAQMPPATRKERHGRHNLFLHFSNCKPGSVDVHNTHCSTPREWKAARGAVCQAASESVADAVRMGRWGASMQPRTCRMQRRAFAGVAV